MNRLGLGACPGSGVVLRVGVEAAEDANRSGVRGGVGRSGEAGLSICITCPECCEEMLLPELRDETLLLLS